MAGHGGERHDREIESISPENLEKIDPISHGLWKRCVREDEQKNHVVMRALIDEITNRGMSAWDSNNEVVQRMLEDGMGFDGFQAAMMTLNYVRSLARYYELLAEMEGSQG